MQAINVSVDENVAIPLDIDEPYMDLLERAEAACNTISQLHAAGLETPITEADREMAAKLASAYASNPEKASKAVNNHRASEMTPATLLLVGGILNDFGHKVADNSVQIRHLVTNKLIQESENADPKVRLKALELLGKISDVGLFSDKTEVTVTHQTSDELRDKLRGKLEKIINPQDATPKAITLDGEPIDMDVELGRQELVKYGKR